MANPVPKGRSTEFSQDSLAVFSSFHSVHCPISSSRTHVRQYRVCSDLNTEGNEDHRWHKTTQSSEVCGGPGSGVSRK